MTNSRGFDDQKNGLGIVGGLPGNWCAIPDNYPPGHGEEVIPCSSKGGPHSFALRVKGDSMEPDYPDGSIVIVDPDREPRHNADVVVRLNGEMEATFKRLKIYGSRWYLHPLNDRYPPLPLEGKDFTICGVVVWVGREVG
ncbi:MAG: LexA family protein [Leptospirales bacterium]